MKKVVIVVPTYKTELDSIEEIALTQLFKVLGNYSIAIVCPDSLVINYPVLKGKNYFIERFEDSYFDGIKGYSALCLSQEFYTRFESYEFMLIYQLDVFVFEDKLQEFCDSGYDYFGAPVPKVIWPSVPSQVGNGGFSLRKISKIIRIIEKKQEVTKQILNSNISEGEKDRLLKYEDMFLIYTANLYPELEVKLPNMGEAFKFGIEFNINGIYNNLSNHLPFGCHRWNKYKTKEWWSIISSYGYTLNSTDIDIVINNGEDYSYNRQVLEQKIKQASPNEKKDFAKMVLGDDVVSIWGLGKVSMPIIDKLEQFGLSVGNRYDKNVSLNEKAIYPTEFALIQEQHPIVITSTKFENEIKQEVKLLHPIILERMYTLEDIINKYIEVLNINLLGEQ